MKDKSVEELQAELERLRRGREGGSSESQLASFNNGRGEGKLSPKEEMLLAKKRGEYPTDNDSEYPHDLDAYIEARYEKENLEYERSNGGTAHTQPRPEPAYEQPRPEPVYEQPRPEPQQTAGFGGQGSGTECNCNCVRFTDPMKYQPGLAGALSFMTFGIGGFIYLEEYKEAVKSFVIMLLAYISVMLIIGVILLPVAYFYLIKKSIETAEMKNKLLEDRHYTSRIGRL